MFSFVCLLYSFKAAANIDSKFVDEADVDIAWDMMMVYLDDGYVTERLSLD